MAQNFGDKLVGSLGSLVLGIIVFIGSFVILFNTEGRTDYSKVAEQAVNITEASGDQDFVYTTGELKADAPFGDKYLKDGDYVALHRNVEMYSWVENVEEDENDVKYYSYTTEWSGEPADSEQFHEIRGHENFPMDIPDVDLYAEKAFVGDYEVDPEKARLPSYEEVGLNDEMVYLDDYSEVIDDYFFVGYGTLQDPEIGDIRISYTAVKPGVKATVFGRPDGNIIEAHHGDNEKGLYRIFRGTRDDAVSKLKDEYKTAGWTWRIIGFFVMWLGLLLIFKPLSVAFEAIPFISKLGKSAVAAVTFLAALILTFITTTVSMVLHNPFGIAAIIIVIVGVVYFLMIKRQKKSA